MKFDGYCTQCHNEVGAFVVDGTRRILGYRCIAEALNHHLGTTIGEWMRRNRA